MMQRPSGIAFEKLTCLFEEDQRKCCRDEGKSNFAIAITASPASSPSTFSTSHEVQLERLHQMFCIRNMYFMLSCSAQLLSFQSTASASRTQDVRIFPAINPTNRLLERVLSMLFEQGASGYGLR